jgi:hypothetical protein
MNARIRHCGLDPECSSKPANNMFQMPLDTASAGMTLILFARQINSFVSHCLLSLIISSSLEVPH